MLLEENYFHCVFLNDIHRGMVATIPRCTYFWSLMVKGSSFTRAVRPASRLVDGDADFKLLTAGINIAVITLILVNQ